MIFFLFLLWGWFTLLSSAQTEDAFQTSVPVGRDTERAIGQSNESGAPTVVLVSIDGFRADYLDRIDLPNLRRVIGKGVRAEGLIPVFPSVTFPNHYSIVTGLYPDRHGIINNWFYDPHRRETFRGERDGVTGDWYGGEPIWVTAQRYGLHTACLFWVGCESEIHGVRPTYWLPYNEQLPAEERIDIVLSWLQLPEPRRPHLAILYLTEQLDEAGHWYNPYRVEISYVLQTIDRQLGYLLDRIAALPDHDRIYVFLVSDHGMAEVRPEHVIPPDNRFLTEGVRMLNSGPSVSLHINDNSHYRPETLRDAINERLTHGRAYVRSEIPEHLHHRADPRAGDVVIVMEPPYILGQSTDEEPGGMHGWDPTHPDMHGLFLAKGPGLKEGVTIPAFENVHIYSYLAEILGLPISQENEGRIGWLRQQVSQ